jgi:hypothetical protein
MAHQVHTYTELKQQIHEDLRAQHPEWVEPTGECPECDEHEARLRELLESVTRSESGIKAGQRVSGQDQTTPSSNEIS